MVLIVVSRASEDEASYYYGNNSLLWQNTPKKGKIDAKTLETLNHYKMLQIQKYKCPQWLMSGQCNKYRLLKNKDMLYKMLQNCRMETCWSSSN